MPTSDIPADEPRRMRTLGFELVWLPALKGGLLAWPEDEDSAPPLDTAWFQVEHREAPDGIWQPVLPGDNWRMDAGEAPVLLIVAIGARDTDDMHSALAHAPAMAGVLLLESVS